MKHCFTTKSRTSKGPSEHLLNAVLVLDMSFKQVAIPCEPHKSLASLSVNQAIPDEEFLK